MEQIELIYNTISEFLSQPVPIIVTSALSLGIFLFRFLSTTSVGKKRLNKFETKLLNFGSNIERNKNDIDQYKEETSNEIKNKIEEYETIIEKQNTEIKEMKEALIKISENINNNRVQEIVKELKDNDVENETKESEETL